MNAQQKHDHYETYRQLRLAISLPGETIGEVTKPYAPIDKWAYSWDELMACPDTPDIAARRNVRLPSLWAQIGMRRQVA